MSGCQLHLHEQIQTTPLINTSNRLLLQLCYLVANHRKIWLRWYDCVDKFKFVAQCHSKKRKWAIFPG